MRVFHALLAAAIMAAGAIHAAPAAAQMVTADPTSVANALRTRGLKVEIGTDDSGDPRLTTEDGGLKYEIWFYDCKAHKNCDSIQFYAGFTESDLDEAGLNEWNKGHRFGRAYIDKSGDPAVEMDIDLAAGGMSKALFDDNLDFWVTTVTAFQTFVYKK